MTYVEEIRTSIGAKDRNKILMLWQEYCESDSLDAAELINILLLIKDTNFAQDFGKYVEAIVPLILSFPDEEVRFEALCPVYDVQTSHSQPLYDLAVDLLRKRFGKDPLFQEKLRLVGLRTKDHFQGALSNFVLLNHLAKGNYVFHVAGWGVGKVVDCSFLREQVSIEFENLGWCKRDIAFKSAFKVLSPLSSDHFYVVRLVDPIKLVNEAQENPVNFVVRILKDVGPKTTAELKELIQGYVIEEASFAKWWQVARSRIKKDGRIDMPAKGPLTLRRKELLPLEAVEKALEGKEEFGDILNALYAFARDFSGFLKDKEVEKRILTKVQELLVMEGSNEVERIQLYLFVDQMLAKDTYSSTLKKTVSGLTNVIQTCAEIVIVALRRCFLQAVKLYRRDWETLFAEALLQIDPVQVKDYLFKELLTLPHSSLLLNTLHHLVDHPALYPETFVWFFQKVTSGEAPLMNTQKDVERFFEGFLLLLNTMERRKERRDFVKKMCSLFTGNKFEIVRRLLKDTSVVYAKEFLLLASKCHSFSHHDQKILHSLVEVVHKGDSKEPSILDQSIIWTTEQGYFRTKEKIHHIGTVEMVENAKEIEAARAHGDLRENAEYKAALERRSRLQNELQQLSEQFQHARIIAPGDISTKTIDVGSKVTLKKKSGEEISFTILGQWDASVEKNILSNQSKLAQSLIGKEKGNSFEFLGEPVTVVKIESYTETS